MDKQLFKDFNSFSVEPLAPYVANITMASVVILHKQQNRAFILHYNESKHAFKDRYVVNLKFRKVTPNLLPKLEEFRTFFIKAENGKVYASTKVDFVHPTFQIGRVRVKDMTGKFEQAMKDYYKDAYYVSIWPIKSFVSIIDGSYFEERYGVITLFDNYVYDTIRLAVANMLRARPLIYLLKLYGITFEDVLKMFDALDVMHKLEDFTEEILKFTLLLRRIS